MCIPFFSMEVCNTSPCCRPFAYEYVSSASCVDVWGAAEICRGAAWPPRVSLSVKSSARHRTDIAISTTEPQAAAPHSERNVRGSYCPGERRWEKLPRIPHLESAFEKFERR